MNIAQAKQIALERVLLHIGAEKDLIRSNQAEIWFKSPMRPAEKTASFKIDVLKNLWFDHGEGIGGNIITLGQKHLATESISDVLRWLDGIIGNLPKAKPIKAIQTPKKQVSSPIDSGLLLVKEKKISNQGLIAYASDRRIAPNVLYKFCREIYFKGKGEKPLFGIGIPNDLGGWEVRAAIGNFKAVVGSGKAISTIYGSEEIETIHVFEGLFDFLSKETFSPQSNKEAALLLNSGALVHHGIEKIKTDPRLKNAVNVRLWLQNDSIGKKTLHDICLALEQSHIVGDMSEHYSGYKDLNQSLIENPDKWRPSNGLKIYQESGIPFNSKPNY